MVRAAKISKLVFSFLKLQDFMLEKSYSSFYAGFFFFVWGFSKNKERKKGFFRGGPWKQVQKKFLKKVSQCRRLVIQPISYEYIAEHTLLAPKTKKLSAANKNRARKTLILRQPIRIEHEKYPSTSSANQSRVLRQPSRQPIRIEYYVTRELSATVEDPSRLSVRLGSL